MLNFRNTTIVFFVLLALYICLQVQPWYGYFILAAAYTLLLFYGSFYIGSSFYVKVICKGNTGKKQIAISFDDGPIEKYTPEVLAILREQQVPATFFCIGYRVAEHAALLKQILADGHIVGNHSYYHDFWFDMHGSKRMKAELQQMQDLVHHITGREMKWFRPPYGVTNPNVRKAVRAMGYNVIGWNVRSLDTMIRDEEKLLEKVKKGLKPGAVFLFHDTSHPTVHVLSLFLKYVKAQGYEVVPLDKLINLPPYV